MAEMANEPREDKLSSLQRELSKIREKGSELRDGKLEKMASISMLKGRMSARIKAKTLSGTLSKNTERAKDDALSPPLEGDSWASIDSADENAHSHRSLADGQRPQSGGEGNGFTSPSEPGSRVGDVGADDGAGPGASHEGSVPQVEGGVSNGGTSPGEALAAGLTVAKKWTSVTKIKQKIRDRTPAWPASRGEKGHGHGASLGDGTPEAMAEDDSDDDVCFAFSEVDDHSDDSSINSCRVADSSGDAPQFIDIGQNAADQDASKDTDDCVGEDAVNRNTSNPLKEEASDACLDSLPSVDIVKIDDIEGGGREEERSEFVPVRDDKKLQMLREELSRSEQHGSILAAELAMANEMLGSIDKTAKEDVEMELREEIERMRMDLAEAIREGEEWRHASQSHREEEERLRRELAQATEIVARQRECRDENLHLQLRLKRVTENSKTLANELKASKHEGEALPFFETRLNELMGELEQRDLEVHYLREEICELKGHIVKQQMSLSSPREAETPSNSDSDNRGRDKWGAQLGKKIGSLHIKEKVGLGLEGMQGKKRFDLTQQQQQQQQQQMQKEQLKLHDENEGGLITKGSNKENKKSVMNNLLPMNASSNKKYAERSVGGFLDGLLVSSEGPPAHASNGHDQESTKEQRSLPAQLSVPKTKWKKSHKEKLKELMARDSMVAAGNGCLFSEGTKHTEKLAQAVSAKDRGNFDNILALFQGPPQRPETLPETLPASKEGSGLKNNDDGDGNDEGHKEFLLISQSDDKESAETKLTDCNN